jgi:uncharacterized membrane protein
MKVTRARSLAKTFSWRAIGTADTFLIAWLITKEPIAAASIASIEIVTKMILYYFHERGWNLIQWGRKENI